MKRFAIYVLIALPLLLASGVFMSFAQSSNEKIRGNGNVKQEARNATPFKDISTSGVYKVIILQGNTHSIKIEAEDNLLPYIITDISGGKLDIHSKKGYNIQPTKEITVYITLQKVERLSASGAGGFSSNGLLKSDLIKLEFSGAADADLNINTHELEVSISGASNVKLKGNSSEADYRISGSADIAALDLQTDNVRIGISGTGKANVNAQKKLDISVSGMGKVKYTGEPSITQAISGMGKISKI
ncbi:putative autotransporter adhesin-like protein [Chitinophaga niastensis]|uniref:Putative autotransporter adhesin-like protein n=1 Tax=Chitinophaga niastensis TaxID=536980 RepID=A0A2P8HPI2_CHINA|nr:head GIN domain-containing protein [Chitinophaga niastensis]PSL48133.1 putative autotransporter adhesin-like protein [Chitinophaga niastensis]